jgi:hypothetical protein
MPSVLFVCWDTSISIFFLYVVHYALLFGLQLIIVTISSVHDHKLTAMYMNVQSTSAHKYRVRANNLFHSSHVHALLRPRSQCGHEARWVGPEAARLFPLLAEGGAGELGELSAIISPDRRCFRPNGADVGNANCANTA